MLALAIMIAIALGVVLAMRWSSRRTQDISDYYSDFEDPTTEVLLRTNEMRGNHR